MKLTGLQYIPKGLYVYNRLKNTDKDALKIVYPGGIGDTIQAMRLTEEFLRINQVKKVIVIVKEAQQDIPDWYSLKAEKIVLSAADMRGLSLYILISHKFDQDQIYYAYHRRDRLGRAIRGGNLSETYSNSVMYVPEEKAVVPEIPFVECKEYMDTVLLAPYSYSMKDVPLSFYQKLAHELADRGYTVYTNVHRAEKPLDRTTPLYLTLSELMRSAPNFRLIISSRSGLCDALALCKCDLAVIHQKHYVDAESGRFSNDISDLYGFKTVTNLLYSPDSESSLIQTCLELVKKSTEIHKS